MPRKTHERLKRESAPKTRSASKTHSAPKRETLHRTSTPASAALADMSGAATPADILALQKSVGNVATGRLLGAAVAKAVSPPPARSTPPSAAVRKPLKKWPKKEREAASLVEELRRSWPSASPDDAEEFYEWCSGKDHYREIPTKINQTEWEGIKGAFPTGSAAFSEAAGGLEGMKSYLTFLKAKAAPPVTLNLYDVSSYTGPSETLVKEADDGFERGVADVERISRDLYHMILAADRNRVAAEWEKANNPSMSPASVGVRSETIREASEAIAKLLAEVKLEKEKQAAKERSAREMRASIEATRLTAEELPEFAAVRNNTLANAVWNRSVETADKTGFVDVDDTTYEERVVRAATRKLKRFAEAWKEKAKKGELPPGQILSNPHCPGGGRVQSKLTSEHSSHEARRSSYQADFIATWGTNVVVVHINADKAST